MKRWIHASSDETDTEAILEDILHLLEEDYYYGGESIDDIYMILTGDDKLSEEDLRRAMDTSVGYLGFDSDELEEAFSKNRKVAHDIAVRLKLPTV